MSVCRLVLAQRGAFAVFCRLLSWFERRLLAFSPFQALLDLPFLDLLWQAQAVHRQHWPAGDIELATLLSVKTGGCPENCGYCPQPAQFDTGVAAQKLLPLDEMLAAARAAREAGATCFCMGAAWRTPKERDIETQTCSTSRGRMKAFFAILLIACSAYPAMVSANFDAILAAGPERAVLTAWAAAA